MLADLGIIVASANLLPRHHLESMARKAEHRPISGQETGGPTVISKGIQRGIVHTGQYFGPNLIAFFSFDFNGPSFVFTRIEFVAEGFKTNVEFLVAPRHIQTPRFLVKTSVQYHGHMIGQPTAIGFFDGNVNGGASFGLNPTLFHQLFVVLQLIQNKSIGMITAHIYSNRTFRLEVIKIRLGQEQGAVVGHLVAFFFINRHELDQLNGLSIFVDSL